MLKNLGPLYQKRFPLLSWAFVIDTVKNIILIEMLNVRVMKMTPSPQNPNPPSALDLIKQWLDERPEYGKWELTHPILRYKLWAIWLFDNNQIIVCQRFKEMRSFNWIRRKLGLSLWKPYHEPEYYLNISSPDFFEKWTNPT